MHVYMVTGLVFVIAMSVLDDDLSRSVVSRGW